MYFTRAEIDNTLYYVLQKGLMDLGFWPTMPLFPDMDKSTFEALLAGVVSSGKLPCQVFGVGTPRDRGIRESPRIVINRKDQRRGDIGTSGVMDYDRRQDGSFDKSQLPDATYDLEYDIRVIAPSISYLDLLEDLLADKLGEMRYLETMVTDNQPSGKTFLLTGGRGINMIADELFEFRHVYVVKNVYIQAPKLLGTVAPMSSISGYAGIRPLPNFPTPDEPDATLGDVPITS